MATRHHCLPRFPQYLPPLLSLCGGVQGAIPRAWASWQMSGHEHLHYLLPFSKIILAALSAGCFTW
jgi:hypothetical protein